jgi:hypothetical protein
VVFVRRQRRSSCHPSPEGQFEQKEEISYWLIETVGRLLDDIPAGNTIRPDAAGMPERGHFFCFHFGSQKQVEAEAVTDSFTWLALRVS